MSYSKKKLNMGIIKVIDKIKIWRSFSIILNKLVSGMKPPDEIIVNDRLKASKRRKSARVKRKITIRHRGISPHFWNIVGFLSELYINL